MAEASCPECPITTFGFGGRGAHLVFPSVILPTLACLVVVNRLYWRFNMVGRLGVDDFIITLALIFFMAQCGASVAAVDFGYGRPSDTMNRRQASQALKCFFLLQIFYKLTINCTKLSILFLYVRIFTDRVWFVRTCWVLIALVTCACISFTTATLLQCLPVDGAWDRWGDHHKCFNIYALWYGNAVYNILTDFILVLMVPPVIFRLKLPIRQKLALTCIFGLGVIVCAASISRLTTLYSSAYGTDPTAGSLVSTVWTTIEAGLGIICASLPMLRTPLQRLFPSMFPSRSASNRISSTCSSGRGGSANMRTLVLPATVDRPPTPSQASGLQDRPVATDNLPSWYVPDNDRNPDVLISLPHRIAHLTTRAQRDLQQDRRFYPCYNCGQRYQGEGWYEEEHRVW